jgi:hypothetical protein
VVERQRRPLRTFRELVTVGEVAQGARCLDFAGVPELRECEKAVAGVSCGKENKGIT